MQPLRTVGSEIRARRQGLGYSQLMLGKKVGISRLAVSRIERDEQEPPLSVAARLSQALGVKIETLAEAARRAS